MPNRLANESSPYLLQHAENPVDWYSWSPEALAAAQHDDKPIFLSIGYSACHWCHVMEHESFENPDIATFLNENFISIKVDREERPDLDQIYMQAVTMLRQGQGGWPLSVFLTPTAHCFYGGTYWPPTSRHGIPGFDHVLRQVLAAYREKRDEIDIQAGQITEALAQVSAGDDSDFSISVAPLFEAANQLESSYDFDHGGFGSAPKFPHPMDLELLIRLWRRWPLDRSDRDLLLEMVQLNLKKMAYGGIHDQLAGGFSRYSVDARWLVPHFEKMLYDNAQLASVCVHAFQASGDLFLTRIAETTLEYLLNYMHDSSGGFHSAEDADSEGEEGKFYVWTPGEILETLGPEQGETFCQLYDVSETGNFEGKNILHLSKTFGQFAELHQLNKQSLQAEMRGARKKLLEVRDRRTRPGKDDKILVSWNALAIEAFARAGAVLDRPEYLRSATAAANFIWDHMRDDEGRLLHTWRGGKAKLDAYLDDYAYLANAFCTLYQAVFDHVWLQRAISLMETTISRFWDEKNGGFFFTADDHEQLISRHKDFQDSSVPSGNSMAALALVRMGRLCNRPQWVEAGRATIESASGIISRAPAAAGNMMVALESLTDESTEIVLAVDSVDERARAAIHVMHRYWHPGYSLVLVDHSDPAPEPLLAELMKEKTVSNSKPTLYVCHGFACERPAVDIDDIQEQLEQLYATPARLDFPVTTN